MWTLENVRTDLVNFLVPKMTPATWILNLKRGDNRDFCVVQNLTREEADFNWFIRLKNLLVIAAENFGREQNLSSLLIPTIAKDMDEQIKLANKLIAVVDQAIKRDLCDSAASQFGKAINFICSRPKICKEEGGRKISTNCLCEA